MQPEQSSERLALVVGNGNYKSAARLRNPVSDARAVAARLVDLGFQVRTEYDLDGERFQRVIGEFCGQLGKIKEAGGKATALLFFAGHGVQVRGDNYLLPVDGDIASEVDLKLRTIHLNVVMEAMSSSAATSVVLLDCCRDNPLPRITGPDGRTRSLGGNHGLAGVDVPSGTFVAYSTQPDNVAEDGQGDNSPFTEALLQYITQADTPISELMIHVRRTVHSRTGGRQIPWDRSALFQPFAFLQRNPLTRLPQASPEEIEQARENEYWSLIEKSESPQLLQSFIQQFPGSPMRSRAMAKLDDIRDRLWRRGLITWSAGVLLSIATMFLAFVGFEYLRFSNDNGNLDNADLIGGDIELPITRDKLTSMFWCRMECIFNTKCVAISYDPKNHTCYTKLHATYFIRPNLARGDDPSNTEFVLRRGRKPPVELKAPWTLHWERTLVGVPVPRELVEADTSFKDATNKTYYREDARTKKSFWRVESNLCQKKCEDLKENCKGFSYTPFGSRCQLFQTVRGMAREQSDGSPVHTPANYSLCNDPLVADCKQSE